MCQFGILTRGCVLLHETLSLAQSHLKHLHEVYHNQVISELGKGLALVVK